MYHRLSEYDLERPAQESIGFIGAGQMAKALAQGFLRAGLVDGSQMIVCDPSAAAIAAFQQAIPGSDRAADSVELAERCNVVVLAVKPQHARAALAELKPAMTDGKLLISIVTGLTLQCIGDRLGAGRIVRVMPNTPCLVGESASAYCAAASATAADMERIAALLGSVGLAISVDEKLLDAVTGLSGSGPAYGYVMIEALADGGVKMGLPREIALQLAAQTLKGAAEMVLATGEHPGLLKDRVASPGGTTIAGLAKMEEHGVRGALMATVEAAARRATELAAE